MIPTGAQHLAGKLRRNFGWKLRVIALASLALGACVVSSSRSPKSAPDPALPASPGIAAATQGVGLEFIPAGGSEVKLQGSSTIGAWTCRSADIHGQIILYADETELAALFDRIEAAAPKDQSGLPVPPLALPVRAATSADISVPVMSLRGDSIGMDSDMQKALNAAAHPMIEFVFQDLQQATVQRDLPGQKAELKLTIAGTLHMAGAARKLTMDVTINREPGGHFLARAQTTMLMSDFAVTPPVALFGLIKGGDRVQVIFDLDLVLKSRLSANK